ncbi:hypothetical protein BSLG_000165 [Batrachochytrium salamandrivorans]|nr:hypothetical protein BSLG_001564 [Batrachochytrium salamandrivorans]KAJ1344642.1 hypothetical protein BSLG_000165 [Batrachochytrium salamandrivorans]
MSNPLSHLQQHHQQHMQSQHLQHQPTSFYSNQQPPSLAAHPSLQHSQYPASIDPNILSLPQFTTDIKEDEFLESPRRFTLHNDFDMSCMSLNKGGTVAAPQDQKLMASLSSSPQDGTTRGTATLQTQPNGFFSMSMPMHSSSFGQVEANSFLGSHASSFGSFGHTPGQLSVSVEDEIKTVDSLTEKRRRRRESHNAVERRRRDHINDKIHELSNLLPEFASDIQNKPNKGVILRRSVDYIRHMQLFAAKQMERTMELEVVLGRIIREQGIQESDLGLSMPLGTAIELPAITGVNQDEEDMM